VSNLGWGCLERAVRLTYLGGGREGDNLSGGREGLDNNNIGGGRVDE